MERIEDSFESNTVTPEHSLDVSISSPDMLRDRIPPKIKIALQRLLALATLFSSLESDVQKVSAAENISNVFTQSLPKSEREGADLAEAERQVDILSEQVRKSGAGVSDTLNSLRDGFGLSGLDQEEENIIHGEGSMAEKSKKIEELRATRERLHLESNTGEIALTQAKYMKRASELKDLVLSNASKNPALAEYLADYTKYGATIDDKDPNLQIQIYERILAKFNVKSADGKSQTMERGLGSVSEDIISEAERAVGDISKMIQELKTGLDNVKKDTK